MTKVPKFRFEDYPPAKPANVANHQPGETTTLAKLATLGGGKSENQISHPAAESPQASKKPASVCPQCQGEIFLRTSFGKTFCFQCLFNLDGEMDISSTGLKEVDRVLEDAIEAAEERAAILEFDAGLRREEADEKARGLHIQPTIDDLLLRGLVSIQGGVPGAQISTAPAAKPAKVANLQPVEPPQTSLPACTCAECPWYQLNPWTHNPALGAWCHYRMEPLEAGSPACEQFNRGELPPRQKHESVPQVQPTKSPATQEGVLTCADCPHFEPNRGPNPGEGWGKCLRRGRGRYGSATACEAALDFKEE